MDLSFFQGTGSTYEAKAMPEKPSSLCTKLMHILVFLWVIHYFGASWSVVIKCTPTYAPGLLLSCLFAH